MRAINRIVAALVALVLLGASAITLVEIALAALGKSPWIVNHTTLANDLHHRVWQDGWVRFAGASAVIVGLLLLYVAFRRGAPTDLPLQTDEPGVTFTVTRKSLESYAAGIAESETGVDSASVKARKARVTVTASTMLLDPGDLEQRVQAAVAAHLGNLHLAHPVNTAVSVRNRGN